MGRYQEDQWSSAVVLAGASATLISQRWIGKPGRIFALGAEVSDMSLWGGGNTRFSVLLNGVPVPGYGRIRDRIGSVDLMTAVDIYLPPYALIEVTVENASGSDSTFIARYKAVMEEQEAGR